LELGAVGGLGGLASVEVLPHYFGTEFTGLALAGLALGGQRMPFRVYALVGLWWWTLAGR
jgi:hypothetical protein